MNHQSRVGEDGWGMGCMEEWGLDGTEAVELYRVGNGVG